MNRIIFFAIFFFTLLPLAAYCSDQGPEMAELMRSNGKIYVVVAVLMIIFTGIIAFLIHLERSIKKAERDSNQS